MVMVLTPASTILAAILVGLVSATDVSVQHDATYTIDSSRGPICSGSGAAPAGTACPLKGDIATVSCLPGLPSYTESDCVAPVDAQCVVVTGSTWGCAFPQSGGEETPCPSLPLPAVETLCPSLPLPNGDGTTGYSGQSSVQGSSEQRSYESESDPVGGATKTGTTTSNYEISATEGEDSHDHNEMQETDGSHDAYGADSFASQESEHDHNHDDHDHDHYASDATYSEGSSSSEYSEQTEHSHDSEEIEDSHDTYTTQEDIHDEYGSEGASTTHDEYDVEVTGSYDSEAHDSHDYAVEQEDGCESHGDFETEESNAEEDTYGNEEIEDSHDHAEQQFEDSYEMIEGDSEDSGIEQVNGSLEEYEQHEDDSENEETDSETEETHDSEDGDSHSYGDHAEGEETHKEEASSE